MQWSQIDYLNLTDGSLYVFDASTNTTTLGARTTNTMRTCATMSSLDDSRLLLCGGSNLFTTPIQSACEWYNATDGLWTPAPPMPAVLYAHAQCTAGSKVVVFGGMNTGGPPMSAATHVYDRATNAWTTKAPMPVAMSYTACATLDTTLVMVCGGQTWDGSSVASASACHVYDVAGNAWTASATAIVNARSMHRMVWHAGRLYLLGGGNWGAPTPVEVWNATTNVWTDTGIILGLPNWQPNRFAAVSIE